MAGQLTLMTSGLNDWPDEHLNEAHHDAYEFWHAAMSADAEGRLEADDMTVPFRPHGQVDEFFAVK
ncbi:hypothetical protein NKH45_34365 [Mesorhizobium sp. M1156]|uniref:hypothetical protein n=1 Tax=Mesorhizobium sp. M1156 TaxID=2957064 RepID=UPI00333A5E94